MEARIPPNVLLLLFVFSTFLNTDSFLLEIKHCFGEIGCLRTDREFYHPYRPTNPTPYRREEVNVTYTVWSREDRKGKVVRGMQVTDIRDTSFKNFRKTKILIHGYLDIEGETWMYDQASALLEYGDFNVVAVNWGGGSRAMYDQAAANARVVGLEIAFLIHWLRDYANHRPRDVHLIGHSLGAHVAGYAGERVLGIGRITGLDPAGPYFEDLPPSVRLDPTDAIFVDVIHTDSDPLLLQGLGMKAPCGHLDFYPNGGRNQPGCERPLTAAFDLLHTGIDINNGLTVDQKLAVTCSHSRSTQLFTSSLISQCDFQSYYCYSYLMYLTGICQLCGDGTWCGHMGINADEWPGIGKRGTSGDLQKYMYVETTAEFPYC